jgi:transposase
MADKLKALEREDRELRQAKRDPAQGKRYFAMAELDRRSKP